MKPPLQTFPTGYIAFAFLSISAALARHLARTTCRLVSPISGNYPNAGLDVTVGDWTNKYSATSVSSVDTLVSGNTTAAQNDITAGGFILRGVTESNTANDVVLFRIRYNEDQAAGVSKTLQGYTLIPEPSAALLGGIGLLALLRRRR